MKIFICVMLLLSVTNQARAQIGPAGTVAVAVAAGLAVQAAVAAAASAVVNNDDGDGGDD